MSSTFSHKDDPIDRVLAEPRHPHDERAWGRRLHLPMQLGLGTATTTQRRRSGA